MRRPTPAGNGWETHENGRLEEGLWGEPHPASEGPSLLRRLELHSVLFWKKEPS